MTWTEEGELQFGVYTKPNQELKNLNSKSNHPPHCFSAITKGVYRHLASLTSLTNKSKYLSIKDIYPRHHQALDSAGLLPKYIPTLQELLTKNEGAAKLKEEKKERQTEE